MTLQEDSMPMGETLQRATHALRETPVSDMPVDLMSRAEMIASNHNARRFWKFYLRPLTACAAILAIIAVILFVIRGSSQMAFAQVAAAINLTHTFTAKADATLPFSLQAGNHYIVKLSVKDSAIRVDSAAFNLIGNQNSRKMLVLIPLLRQAITKNIDPTVKFPDIYGLMRNYHTGMEKSLGEKTIGGRKTQGFQLVRPADASGGLAEDWTFWADPQTSLPIQIEFLAPGLENPVVLTDLHFDVPLDDAIFQTQSPTGYTLVDANPSTSDPWEERKYAGQVFDQRGSPIAGVEVRATERHDTFTSFSYDFCGQPATTDSQGRFSIEFETPGKGISLSVDMSGIHAMHFDGQQDQPIRLEFKHPSFLYARLEDLNLLPPQQRADLHVRLRDGKTVTGRAVDSTGKPVIGATIEAVYGRPEVGRPGDTESRFSYSKKAVTDAKGNFSLRGLPASVTVLQLRRTDPALPLLWGQATVNLIETGDLKPVEIVARSIELPPGTEVHTLWGMKLVDVDDDLRNRLSLYSFATLLVLDPGPNAARLGLGELQQGDCFWHADLERIKDFDDFARHLLAAAETQKKSGWQNFSVNVLFAGVVAGDDKNGTANIRPTSDDLAELEKVVNAKK